MPLARDRFAGPADRRARLVSATAVALLHLGVAYLLLLGLSVDLPRRTDRALALFDLTAPVPPEDPAPPPPPPRAADPQGRAAPPNLRAAPKPIAAPPSPVPLPPPPVLAAPVAGLGDQAAAGAAAAPGPVAGAGGAGEGLGGGGLGDGAGGTDVARPARRLSGELRNADYPRAAVRARAQGDVVAHLSIDPDGLVAECRVARSSGSADLDATTCRLIRERFRYRPALDAEGRPVADQLGWRQSWWLDR